MPISAAEWNADNLDSVTGSGSLFSRHAECIGKFKVPLGEHAERLGKANSKCLSASTRRVSSNSKCLSASAWRVSAQIQSVSREARGASRQIQSASRHACGGSRQMVSSPDSDPQKSVLVTGVTDDEKFYRGARNCIVEACNRPETARIVSALEI